MHIFPPIALSLVLGAAGAAVAQAQPAVADGPVQVWVTTGDQKQLMAHGHAIGFEQAAAEARADYVSGRNMMLGASALALVLGVVAAIVLTRGILQQLGGEPGVGAEVGGRHVVSISHYLC